MLERGDAFDPAVVDAFAHTVEPSRHAVAA
jgi:hypothetical protein